MTADPSAASASARLHSLLWGPAVLLIVTVIATALLLVTNHDDPTYSCRHIAMVQVFDPEQGSPPGADSFDSGRACNRDARQHVLGGAVILVLGGAGAAFWARRPRINQ